MFYDIFSKKQLKTKTSKPLPKIIADIHEKNSLVLAELSSSKEIELIITSLKIGDYLINEIAIERKTISDFISSMINKRLLDQINQMQTYEQKLILIEGNLDETNFNPNAIRGFIISILLNHKIPIIFTKNSKETATYLMLLAKQQLKPTAEISLHSRIPKTEEEQKQYVLESFPNIGPATAKKLLKEFKTISNIFTRSEEELSKILKGKAKDFKRLLDQ